jgi:hypothetical protein
MAAPTGRAEHGARTGSCSAGPDIGRVPSTSEARAVEALRAQGFTASFVVGAPGTLRVTGKDRDFLPRELAIRAHQRFEGTSDPDDMSIVYAIEAVDGTKGTLVDAFGVYSNPAVTAVIDQVPSCERGTG